jgi:hypothetical protein
MSLGFCLLTCVGCYQLGRYNVQHPGRAWERMQLCWELLKAWAKQ